jgi:predicted nucleic acid-binding protein
MSPLLKGGALSLKEAKACIVEYECIPIRFVDIELESAISLAHPHRMWAYDAYVLQSASSLGLPLLTLDGPQSRIAQKIGITLWGNLS